MGQFPEPSPEEILAAVDHAGWLLEQQAARILANHDFYARPNWAFRDADEPTKSRELDVWSFRLYHTDNEAKVQIGASVLVECKQSAQPYCAIGQELPEWRRAGNPAEHSLPARFVPKIFDFENNRLEYAHLWDVLGYRELGLEYGQTDFRAAQLTRLELKSSKWSAANAGIFNELVYPLAKAIRADQKSHGQRRDMWPRPGDIQIARTDYVGYTIRFPVVLISCPLYVVDATAPDPAVETSKWVRVQRHLDSEKLTGVFEFDVVTRDAFPEYVETVVHGFMTALTDKLRSNPLLYTGELWLPPGVPPDGKYSTSYPGNDWV